MKKSLLIVAAIAGTMSVNAAFFSWNTLATGQFSNGDLLTTGDFVAIIIWDTAGTGWGGSTTTPYRDPDEIALGDGSGLYQLNPGNRILDVSRAANASGRVLVSNKVVTWGANTASYLDPVTGNPVFPVMPPTGALWGTYYVVVYNDSDITLATQYQMVTWSGPSALGVDNAFTVGSFPAITQGGWQPITIIPEPTAMALLALGAAAVGLRRRFRK